MKEKKNPHLQSYNEAHAAACISLQYITINMQICIHNIYILHQTNLKNVCVDVFSTSFLLNSQSVHS